MLFCRLSLLRREVADILAARAKASSDKEKNFHHKPLAQSSMDHAIPKLTLRRFKTRFSCSFFLQLLASYASERAQHHGAHPWIRGKLKQKRPKAILKNRHFLIKGVDPENDRSSAHFANAGRLCPRTFFANIS